MQAAMAKSKATGIATCQSAMLIIKMTDKLKSNQTITSAKINLLMGFVSRCKVFIENEECIFF